MKLFVYGTLRLGHPNGARFGLTADRLVEQGAKLHGFNLFDISWFPGVQPAVDPQSGARDLSSAVTGDVFEVPDNLWPALDSYEGAPNLYRRETVQIEGHGDVEVYVYNHRVNPDAIISSGEWKVA